MGLQRGLGCTAGQRRGGRGLPADPGGGGLCATARPGGSGLAAHRSAQPAHTPPGGPPPAAAGGCRRLRGALHRRRHGLGPDLLPGCPAPSAAGDGALGWLHRDRLARPSPPLGDAAADLLPSSGAGVAAPRSQLGAAQAGWDLPLDRRLHDWASAKARPALLDGLIDHAPVLDWSWHSGAAEAPQPA